MYSDVTASGSDVIIVFFLRKVKKARSNEIPSKMECSDAELNAVYDDYEDDVVLNQAYDEFETESDEEATESEDDEQTLALYQKIRDGMEVRYFFEELARHQAKQEELKNKLVKNTSLKWMDHYQYTRLSEQLREIRTRVAYDNLDGWLDMTVEYYLESSSEYWELDAWYYDLKRTCHHCHRIWEKRSQKAKCCRNGSYGCYHCEYARIRNLMYQ